MPVSDKHAFPSSFMRILFWNAAVKINTVQGNAQPYRYDILVSDPLFVKVINRLKDARKLVLV